MSASALKAIAGAPQAQRAKSILDYLEDERVRKGLAAVAGKYMTAERMLRLSINAVKRTPRLLQCDPQSVLGAIMTTTALGLEPNTVQQQAFLIPYRRRAKVGNDWIDVYECQFQIGARGFVTLAYRSPLILALESEAIHQGDRFEQLQGSQSFLRYAKALGDRGPLIGAFSYARLRDGMESSYVMPLDEILRIRARSETYRTLTRDVEQAENDKARAKAQAKLDETPWVMWEDDMAAKSCVKKHAKSRLPIAGNEALARAAEIDDGAGRIDLKAMTDPDLVRAVVGDEEAPPALEHDAHDEAADVFGSAQMTAGPEAAKAEIIGRQAAQQTAEPPPPAPPPPPQDDGERPSYAQLADRMLRATTDDERAGVLEDGRFFLPEDQQADLAKLAAKAGRKAAPK